MNTLYMTKDAKSEADKQNAEKVTTRYIIFFSNLTVLSYLDNP